MDVSGTIRFFVNSLLHWRFPQKMISPQTFCDAVFPLQNCELFDTISKAYCSCLASSKCNSVTSEFCVHRPSTIGTLPCIDHRPSELYCASTIDHPNSTVHRPSRFKKRASDIELPSSVLLWTSADGPKMEPRSKCWTSGCTYFVMKKHNFGFI